MRDTVIRLKTDLWSQSVSSSSGCWSWFSVDGQGHQSIGWRTHHSRGKRNRVRSSPPGEHDERDTSIRETNTCRDQGNAEVGGAIEKVIATPRARAVVDEAMSLRAGGRYRKSCKS